MSEQDRADGGDFEDAESAQRPLPGAWRAVPKPAIIGAVALVAVLIVAGLAWQLTRPSSPAGMMKPAVEPASSGMPFATAEPATPAPQEFNRRVIADWIYACDAADGTKCAITQTLSYSGALRMEVSWRLERTADGAFVSVWTVPTNILVRRGLALDLGNGKPAAIPLDSCSPTSCEVRANLDAGFVDTLKQATKIAASVVFKNNKSFTFDFSTRGLSDALAALGATAAVSK